MINDYAQRHHNFTGCFNFRDIGGYTGMDGRKIKWGLYYRAGRQDRMTSADLERMEKLGIKTQVDLRRSDEIENQTRGPLEAMGAKHAWHPVMPDDGSERLNNMVGDTGISGERYLGYLQFDHKPWSGIFDIMADADQLPLLIHCTAGKDRTGVTTALLLSILGVHRDVIEADYNLTNLDTNRQYQFLEPLGEFPEDMTKELFLHHAGVPEAAMKDFLNGLELEYGGALNYLTSIGIDAQQQQAIQLALLEPATH